jgi:Common central domain of tyrosinase
MRSSILAALLVAGAAARDLRVREDNAPVKLQVGDFTTPKFQTVSPEDALASLSAKAHATPTAVRMVAGMPFSVDSSGLIHDVVATGTPVKDHSIGAVPKPKNAPPTKEKRQSSCTNPAIVQEWNNASDGDKQAFTAAIKCLFSQPSRSGLAGAQSRWDDLAAIHQGLNTQIHGVGQFLPWHRYFVWIFEQELRNTCGYQGAMIWWDETQNAGSFTSAPMFTSDYFGSAPDGGAVCITDGVSSTLDFSS